MKKFTLILFFSFMFICVSFAQIITTGNPLPDKVCPGGSVRLTFTVSVADFQVNNFFAIVLSDSTGNFLNGVIIDTVSLYKQGTILRSYTIPDTIKAGIHYKLNVVGSLPSVIGIPSAVNLTVYPRPFVTTMKDSTIGKCNKIVLQTTGSGGTTPYSFSWSPSDATLNNTNLEDPQIINAKVGTTKYAVAMYDKNFCYARDTVAITTITAPTAFVMKDTAIGICQDTVVITTIANGTNLSYDWTPKNLSLDDETVKNALISNPLLGTTKYKFKVTDKYNCTAVDSIYVTVDALPVVKTRKDTAISGCNTTLVLKTTASGAVPLTFTWDPDDASLNNINIANPVIAIPAEGVNTYYISVTDRHGCINEDTVNITVAALPVADYTYTMIGDSVAFTNLSTDADSVKWDFGDSKGTSKKDNPKYLFAADGDYDVSLTAYNKGCIDNYTETITIILTGVCKHTIANAFVYPNPTSGIIVVTGSVANQLEITDLCGKNIQKIILSEDKTQIDISNLPNGVYFIRVGDKVDRIVLAK